MPSDSRQHDPHRVPYFGRNIKLLLALVIVAIVATYVYDRWVKIGLGWM
jgi:hypothetical protein